MLDAPDVTGGTGVLAAPGSAMRTSSECPAVFDSGAFLATCTQAPGVYRMFDSGEVVLYVGKARNLRKRLASYFRRAEDLTPKTRALVAQIATIQVTTTETEAEAFLLEANLIKQHRPRYNILLRDDKSYPFIFVSDHVHPRIGVYRGARRKGVRYFGPYPSTGAVRETLRLLQKIFRVRSCEESVYAHRSRPCLQHQINRCTAPCVGLIDTDAYAADVAAVVRFLQGRSDEVIAERVQRMEQASNALRFEEAARLRDQIASLRQISEQQYVAGGAGDADVIALARSGMTAAVQIFFMRQGQNIGNVVRFPRLPEDASDAEILSAVVAQFYAVQKPPQQVLVSARPEDAPWLQQLLEARRGGRVRIAWSVRGERQGWLRLALRNAEMALQTQLASRQGQESRMSELVRALGLPTTPQRMECYDISHTQGECTVASCVVFGPEGPIRSDYRRFNIEGVTPGDDYAAMRQVLSRRFARIRRGEGHCPDLVFIDGGKGQVAQAISVLTEMELDLRVVGVAKGPDRRAGLETLVLSGIERPSILPPHSGALHLIQQIRDEAHRFAITGHRGRRAKARTESPLEAIPGLGPRRRAQLLRFFGGLQGVKRAGVDELAKVPGISQRLAASIHAYFHEG